MSIRVKDLSHEVEIQIIDEEKSKWKGWLSASITLIILLACLIAFALIFIYGISLIAAIFLIPFIVICALVSFDQLWSHAGDEQIIVNNREIAYSRIWQGIRERKKIKWHRVKKVSTSDFFGDNNGRLIQGKIYVRVDTKWRAKNIGKRVTAKEADQIVELLSRFKPETLREG